MANVTVSTKAITREKLAQFFPGNHELVRFLESIAKDVIVNIPDAINPAVEVLDQAQEAAELAGAISNAAKALALQALATITEGDLLAQLSAVRDRMAIAERAIAELKEGPTP